MLLGRIVLLCLFNDRNEGEGGKWFCKESLDIILLVRANSERQQKFYEAAIFNGRNYI